MKNTCCFIAALMTVLLAGCTKPIEPLHDSPFDSENVDMPGAEIISGPLQGEIVHDTLIGFAWKRAGSAIYFSHCIDSSSWSSWTTDTIITYPYLYEGNHVFRIKARNGRGDTSDVVERTFIQDNVTGPAVALYPWYLKVQSNTSFVIYYMLEDVMKNTSSTHLSVTYDPSKIVCDTTSTQPGILWNQNGGTVIGPYNSSLPTSGVIDYLIGVVGGNPAGVVGSGKLLALHFTALGALGSRTIIEIMPSTEIRDTINTSIPVLRQNCIVDIQ